MSTSKTQISNMALAHCAVGETIDDFDNDDSNAAIQCRLFFDHCFGLLLEMQELAFANRTTPLVSIGNPRNGWAYRYAYPNFCALALFVGDDTMGIPLRDQRVPFKVIDRQDAPGKAILTNLQGATLEYNHRIEDVSMLSFTAVQGLSLLLGSHIATPLRVKENIARAIEQRFGVWMNEAGMHTLRESRESAEPDSGLVSGRA